MVLANLGITLHAVAPAVVKQLDGTSQQVCGTNRDVAVEQYHRCIMWNSRVLVCLCYGRPGRVIDARGRRGKFCFSRPVLDPGVDGDASNFLIIR